MKRLCLLPIILLASTARCGASNLVRNSDFSRCFAGRGAADAWATGQVSPGATVEYSRNEGMDGGAGQVIRALPSSDISFYICRQAVRGLHPGDHAVLSVYVRTEGIADGHGAYSGVNYFDAGGKRITWTDTDRSITGTSGWQRLVQKFTVPAGTERVEMNLVLHGHGVAIFDRAQVELGDTATGWQPAETPAGPAGGVATVGILQDSLPPSGVAANPARLRALTTAAGYRCVMLTAAQMADPAALSAQRIRILVLPYGGAFPASAADNLRLFLQDGGRLVNLGGYPFDRPLARVAGKWVDATEVEPDTAGSQPLTPGIDSPGWSTSGRDLPGTPLAPTSVENARAILFGTTAMPPASWVSLHSPPLNGLPADARQLIFRARSMGGDFSAAMEITEKDGARWRSVLRFQPRWRTYSVDLAALEYWHDNPSVGRGGPGDMLKLANAIGIHFGISTEFVKQGGSYRVALADLRISTHAAPRTNSLHLNSASGGINPATFLVPQPDAISICDAGSPLRGVVRMAANPAAQDLAGAPPMAAQLTGWSATGQTAYGDPGAPIKARWESLADVRDRYGRIRGSGFGIMWNFGGAYPGTAWAYSGVNNCDVVGGGSRLGGALFTAALHRLARGLFLYEAQAEPACARPGEPVVVSARVGNLGAADVPVTVSMAAACAGKALAQFSRVVTVPAGSSAPVRFDYVVPAGTASGLIALQFSVQSNGLPPNKLECGLAVWSPDRQRAGAQLAYSGNVMSKGRGPEFLMGTQIYWGDQSITGSDPLKWARQFAGIADSGLGIARAFMNVPGAGTEEGWRKRDALVQLAQESGVSLFYEGISWPSEDPAEISRKAEAGAQAADRYRAAPGWFVDIRNEPNMRVTATGPNSERTMADRMRAWAKATRDAIVAVDPTRLVSVGYLQGFGSGNVAWDPVVGSRDMDFANRHYYGPVSDYAAELAQIDLRLLGKAPSTGEFGATSHPGLKQHPVYETEAEAVRRYSILPHQCFGLGGLFISNWHWQDPIEDIFPCGLLTSEGATRERYQAFRNCSALFRAISPRPANPPVWMVLPDSRFGARRGEVQARVNEVLTCLIGLHVEFGVVSQEDISRLPAGTRAVVWPAAPLDGATPPAGKLVSPTESGPSLRVELAAALAECGVQRHAVAPDVPALQSFRVAGEGRAVAQLLVNMANVPVTVTITDLPDRCQVTVGPQSTGALIFNKVGALVAAEGRAVWVGGNPVFRATGTLGAVALDGSALRTSGQALLLPWEPGAITLFGSMATAGVSVGEIKGRAWREYERVAPAGGKLSLDYAAAHSWLLAAPPLQMKAAMRRAASATVPPVGRP